MLRVVVYGFWFGGYGSVVEVTGWWLMILFRSHGIVWSRVLFRG